MIGSNAPVVGASLDLLAEVFGSRSRINAPLSSVLERMDVLFHQKPNRTIARLIRGVRNGRNQTNNFTPRSSPKQKHTVE